MLISALVSRSDGAPPAQVLDAVLRGDQPVLVSGELLSEYFDVLHRERLRRRHGRDDDAIDALVARIIEVAEMASPAEGAPEGPDPGDAHLWRLLRSHPAAVLVTGDRALVRNPPTWATVLTPRQWVDRRKS